VKSSMINIDQLQPELVANYCYFN